MYLNRCISLAARGLSGETYRGERTAFNASQRHARRVARPPPAQLVAASYLDSRITERRNPRTVGIDLASPEEIVDLINAEDRTVADAVATQRAEIARAITLAEETFRGGGRLIYVGAGTSGRLGVLDAAECPPTFGTDP